MQPTTKYLRQTQSGVYEYLLAAHTDAAVNEKIIAEKKLFTTGYGQKMAHTKPHIPVASFVAMEAMEETIIRYTQRICSQQQSFEVALNNYGGCPPHTIYLRVQNPQPFRQLARELIVVSNYVSSCSYPPVQLVTKPHLSIAGHVPETIYLKAMMDFSQKSFYETFMVNELVLLRRSSRFDTGKAVHVFPLQPSQAT